MVSPEQSVHAVNQTSPISIGVPSGDEADLVLDMGASFGLNLDLFQLVPSLQGAFFKNLAVGAPRAVGETVILLTPPVSSILKHLLKGEGGAEE